MSQRIFNMTRKYIFTREYQRAELLAMSESLDAADPVVLRVCREANLEIADEAEALSFTHAKVKLFGKKYVALIFRLCRTSEESLMMQLLLMQVVLQHPPHRTESFYLQFCLLKVRI